MKAALIITNVFWFILLIAIRVNSFRKYNYLINEYDNLKAKEKAYDEHINKCDSIGIYYMTKKGLDK